MRNTHMKFQIPNIHHSKVDRRTHAHTHRQTSRKQYALRWGHNNQRTNGPENAHLKPDPGVLSHHEMT